VTVNDFILGVAVGVVGTHLVYLAAAGLSCVIDILLRLPAECDTETVVPPRPIEPDPDEVGVDRADFH
jgi:hypothetical protein